MSTKRLASSSKVLADAMDLYRELLFEYWSVRNENRKFGTSALAIEISNAVPDAERIESGSIHRWFHVPGAGISSPKLRTVALFLRTKKVRRLVPHARALQDSYTRACEIGSEMAQFFCGKDGVRYSQENLSRLVGRWEFLRARLDENGVDDARQSGAAFILRIDMIGSDPFAVGHMLNQDREALSGMIFRSDTTSPSSNKQFFVFQWRSRDTRQSGQFLLSHEANSDDDELLIHRTNGEASVSSIDLSDRAIDDNILTRLHDVEIKLIEDELSRAGTVNTDGPLGNIREAMSGSDDAVRASIDEILDSLESEQIARAWKLQKLLRERQKSFVIRGRRVEQLGSSVENFLDRVLWDVLCE